MKSPSVMKINKNLVTRSKRQFDTIMARYSQVLEKIKTVDEIVVRRSSSVDESSLLCIFPNKHRLNYCHTL